MYNGQLWPSPSLYGVGHFTEFNLYREALLIAKSKGFIDKALLVREIPQRVKGLVLVDSISETVYTDLIRELTHFEFIQKESKSEYKITGEGLEYLELCSNNKEKAQDKLLERMQEVFVTPAWFINRLWELNPDNQGQVVIPMPLKYPPLKSRKWADSVWTDELTTISKETIRWIQKKIPGCFPYDESQWIEDLKNEYQRLGAQKPRKNNREIPDDDVNYSQRNRLSLAMKTIAVKKFFSRYNPVTQNADFLNKRSDMTHRSFMVWCPRLENFSLMCYTDNNPEIPGRLLYPISSFKTANTSASFTSKPYLQDNDGRTLFIHTPQWDDIKNVFIATLLEVYQNYYNKQTIIYISLQDIRDEVCRLLRISPYQFETFLQTTYEMSVKHEINYSISLETDIRLDMKVKINRRGVYLNGIMYSLIAIKPL